MRKILALAFVFSFAGFAATQDIDFDQGVDTSKIIQNIHNSDYGYYAPDAPKPFGHSRYDRDCARFSFGPSDNDIKSEKVRLRSTEYIEECHQIPVTDAQGNTTYTQDCFERPGQTWRQSAQILIKARKLFPWENEDFEVCLEGSWMDIYIDAAAYKYDVNERGNYDVLYELTPEHKIAMMPDKNGIQFAEFKYDKENKKFIFKINDKWAKEYAGEKTKIKVELYKDGFWFFDSYKGKKEVIFNPSATYDMSFAENELVKSNKDMSEAQKEFKGIASSRGAAKYFVKWGFERIGKISKDKYVKKGKTEKITK